MAVNADTKKMMEFAGFVSRFSENVRQECRALEMAADRYAMTEGEEEVVPARRTSQDVTEILEKADPTLEEIRLRIETYAKVIERMRSDVE